MREAGTRRAAAKLPAFSSITLAAIFQLRGVGWSRNEWNRAFLSFLHIAAWVPLAPALPAAAWPWVCWWLGHNVRNWLVMSA